MSILSDDRYPLLSTNSAPKWSNLKKFIAECVATFLFIVIGCGAIQSLTIQSSDDASPVALVTGIAFAHGLAIFVLVSATANISGGHINPVVSLAFAIVDSSFTVTQLVGYTVAQIVGAIVGTAYLEAMYPSSVLHKTKYGSHQLGSDTSATNGLMIEIALTFVLVLVILRTAADAEGQSFAPLCIGVAVLIDHLVGIPTTGASMNPARSFGPALFSGKAWDNHWIYWVGPIAGSILAAVIYKFLLATRQPNHNY
eukprot:TRINITY_DN7971_c0_g1_i3.p1 TRINITY_DN7971_c0_g1~~TRINITY_DN7971_c0_g1_i3.p1  ORF type:complete len:255 (+),score=22.20 TRINITY_DN7971_c0_g1_i3:36-800(+)